MRIPSLGGKRVDFSICGRFLNTLGRLRQRANIFEAVSSPIHSAGCVARDGATVDIELVSTTACGAHFPFSRFFALSLLYESATTIVDQRGSPLWWSEEAPGGPIGRELNFDELMELTDVETPDEQLISPPTPEQRKVLRQRKQALCDRLVVGVSYGDLKNWRPLLCQARGDRYFDPATSRDAWSRGANDALQETFDRAIERGDDGALPAATLRVEATDVRWTAHLEVGMGWDVYAFDNDAGLLV
jgi:hypothetical protein